MTIRRLLIALLLVPTIAAAQAEPPLARQGYLGAAVTAAPAPLSGVTVAAVTAGGPAERAGLRAGDHIVRIDGTDVGDNVTFARLYGSATAGMRSTFVVLREGSPVRVQVEYAAYPTETIEGVEITRGVVVSDAGHRLRSIIARPAGIPGRLPAVLLVPWLSCATTEVPFDNLGGVGRTLHALPRAGYVLFRVDKASVGDSEGPDCSELDLHTELAGYRAALRELRRLPFVDTSAVFLFGHSLGGALAAVIGADQPIRGFIASGFPTRPWFEHMVDQERRRIELTDMPHAQRNTHMRRFTDFYARYLLQLRTPAEILRDHPHLGDVYGDLPDHQYGRPVRFIQQVQALDVAAAWSRVTAPTLVLYGEYDWLMSRADHELAVDIVNAQAAGRAELIVLPRMNHSWHTFDSARAAFQGTGGRTDDTATHVVLDWLERQRR